MSSKPSDPAQHIAHLEARIAFQEQAIDELSDVVYRQQRTLDRLEARLSQLARRAEELAEQIPGEPREEPPPPHY